MSNESSIPSTPRRPAIHQRQYIVDKPFQYRLIGTLLSLWLMNSVFFTIVLYFFYEGHLHRFYELVPRPGMLPLLSLSALFALSVAFVFTFGFVALALIAVYISNQIAGPLYRTKKCLERVGQGDWAFQLQFRQSDFLVDLPGVFNAMLEGLKRQAEADLEELRAIEAAVNDPATLKRLLRQQRERKEAQLGLGAGGNGPNSEPQSVSLAVH